MAITNSVIDIMTVEELYYYLEKQFTSPLPVDFESTHYAKFISRASSWMEHWCNRPLVVGSVITVPTNDAGTEITKYQPYDSITASASPSKTIPEELKDACALRVVYYIQQSGHFGRSSDTDGDRTHSYNNKYPRDTDDILKKYRYWPTIDFETETIK